MSVFVDAHVQLDSPATMFAVLEELSDATTYPAGYRGTVSFDPSAGWRLEISKQGVATAIADKAVVGDHLGFVLGGKLMHATAAEYEGVE